MAEIGSSLSSSLPLGFSSLAEQMNVQDCFQCQKCSAGCPVVSEMDYTPNQIMQMVSLGMKERLLACRTIWVCASCYTCSTRCPNRINVAGVMDWLRQAALREKVALSEKDVPYFHASFLDSVRSHGRVHELSMLVRYKMKTRRYFVDMKLGWNMFIKGKLRILPSNIRGRKEVAGLFTRSRPYKGKRR